NCSASYSRRSVGLVTTVAEGDSGAAGCGVALDSGRSVGGGGAVGEATVGRGVRVTRSGVAVAAGASVGAPVADAVGAAVVLAAVAVAGMGAVRVAVASGSSVEASGPRDEGSVAASVTPAAASVTSAVGSRPLI